MVERNTDALTLRSSPARKLAGKVDTNDFGALQFPGKTSHDIDSIGTTNTTSDHAETACVGSVRVSTDHKTTGESVVLEDDLVNDTRTGSPEAHTVLNTFTVKKTDAYEYKMHTYLSRGSCQKVVNLLVKILRALQILHTTGLSFDKMVTVDSGGNSSGVHAGRHELENGHLQGVTSGIRRAVKRHRHT